MMLIIAPALTAGGFFQHIPVYFYCSMPYSGDMAGSAAGSRAYAYICVFEIHVRNSEGRLSRVPTVHI